MHDLDRILMEMPDPETDGALFGELDQTGEMPFSEEGEIDLASQLLEISSDQELDQFLGGLVKKAGKFIKSPAGSALTGMLRQVAKKALPVAGKMAGAYFGGPVGAQIGGKLAGMAGNIFGLESEALSDEDAQFEVARRMVRLAGTAAQNLATAPQAGPPAAAARQALVEAARVHAPGLVGGAPDLGRRSGRWVRRGNKVILLGV